nr:MAG TPA: hypothetical protein [Caudoviricetes sp.]
MTIKGFDANGGNYFIGRYVEYWKSGDYFHKKVHYIKCCKYPDGYFTLGHKDDLNYLGHNIEVVFQTPYLDCLKNKVHPICWNDNEY